jgi:chromate reductase, NAD(P)H dehydrogenase (quinone)
LGDKPVAVIGASLGAFGAASAQKELRKVLATIGARVVEGEVSVGRAAERFDENGRLIDPDLRRQLSRQVAALVNQAAPNQRLVA